MRTLALAAALTLASPPGAARAEEAPSPGDWMIRHLGAEPGTLNPVTATDAYEGRINSSVYEGLLDRDRATLQLVPKLAERWEISEDKLSYTFHLRRGARWHDGVPFTADDVLFSFARIQDPTVNAPHLRVYYVDVERVEKLDDYTVRFRYKQRYFKGLEVCGGLPIVAKHLFEKGDFNRNPVGRAPVGTGPYRFLRWDTGKQIVLERNPDYWGEPPKLDRIVYRIITESWAALQVFKKRELDLISLSAVQWTRQTGSARFEERFRKVSYYTPYYNYVGWNLRRPFFADKRVRRAMTMLVDREKILKRILDGLGVVVTGPFYVNAPEYNREVPAIPYDPPAARALLAEAGWADRDGDGVLDKDGVPFRFEFLVSASSVLGEQLATILKEELSKVGVEMTIRKLEWAVFLEKIDAREFDATTLGWSMGLDSDPYQIWHGSQAEKGSNFVGFANAEADGIIEEARREFDAERRRGLYRRLHALIAEEQPYTFLFCTSALVAFDRRFRGVVEYPMGLEPDEWWTPVAARLYP